MERDPILITGIHRSGSTWMGKVLELAPELRYVHEPFNVKKNENVPFDDWFKYVSESSTHELQNEVKEYLKSFQKISFPETIRDIRRAKYLGQVKDVLLDQLNKKRLRQLYKDPIAVMSAEWFYNKLDCDVLVSVRHPAAFVASLKVKDWQFNFNNFLNQEDLMHDKLSAYESQISSFAKEQVSVIDQGILLWNCIYAVVNEYQTKYALNQKWMFVKHEDLSLEPVRLYKEIFERFDLTYTHKVELEIEKSTQSSEKKYLARDAKVNIKSWQSRLTKEEIDRIKEGTKSVWPLFYADRDWN